MSSTTLDRRAERGLRLAWHRPTFEFWPLLLLGSVLAACAWTLAATEIGSGDYGQSLTAARPYLNESLPDYQAASAAAPVVPFLLSVVIRLIGDPIAGVHLFAVLLVMTLGLSAFAVGAALFESRGVGLLAIIAGLLLTDRFLALFASGELTQAGAVVFLWLGVAALWRAGHGGAQRSLWWVVGGACVGLAALSNESTAAIVMPTGVAVGLISVSRVELRWRRRLVLLAPLALAIAAAGAYWVFAVPGGLEFTRNPASLAYAGPSRLLDALVGYWPAIVMTAVAAVGLVVGVTWEIRRRAAGAWTILLVWTAMTLLALLGAIGTGAALDYPGFATVLLAPIVVAAAGAGRAVLYGAATSFASVTRRGGAEGWSVTLAVALVAANIPPAVIGLASNANGYRLSDPRSLQQAVGWIDTNTAPGTAVLAPESDGKWVEGLSGRPALFSSAVRDSFRPDDWTRGLAADALLTSQGALANESFFARFTDDAPDASVPHDLVIGVNHSGEYVDLLRISAAGTRILDGAETPAAVATLPSLAGSSRTVAADGQTAAVTSTWSGDLLGVPVIYRQIVTLAASSSTLEVRASATNGGPAPFELKLSAGQLPITARSVLDARGELTFGVIGSSAPRVRLEVSGGSATLEAASDGGVLVTSDGEPIRLLVTDLTGAGSPTTGAQVLDPRQLVQAYQVGAVVLVQGPSLDALRPRLEALGFHTAASFGRYVVMVAS